MHINDNKTDWFTVFIFVEEYSSSQKCFTLRNCSVCGLVRNVVPFLSMYVYAYWIKNILMIFDYILFNEQSLISCCIISYCSLRKILHSHQIMIGWIIEMHSSLDMLWAYEKQVRTIFRPAANACFTSYNIAHKHINSCKY